MPKRAPTLQVILLPFALPEICGWGEFPMPQSDSGNSGKYHLDAIHVFTFSFYKYQGSFTHSNPAFLAILPEVSSSFFSIISFVGLGWYWDNRRFSINTGAGNHRTTAFGLTWSTYRGLINQNLTESHQDSCALTRRGWSTQAPLTVRLYQQHLGHSSC